MTYYNFHREGHRYYQPKKLYSYSEAGPIIGYEDVYDHGYDYPAPVRAHGYDYPAPVRAHGYDYPAPARAYGYAAPVRAYGYYEH